MYPRCGHARRATCGPRPNARSPLDHVTRESGAKVRDGPRAGITSFLTRPCFRLHEERAKLVDEHARSGSGTVERLDPREALEDRA